jgi:hypothetical protein
MNTKSVLFFARTSSTPQWNSLRSFVRAAPPPLCGGRGRGRGGEGGFPSFLSSAAASNKYRAPNNLICRPRAVILSQKTSILPKSALNQKNRCTAALPPPLTPPSLSFSPSSQDLAMFLSANFLIVFPASPPSINHLSSPLCSPSTGCHMCMPVSCFPYRPMEACRQPPSLSYRRPRQSKGALNVADAGLFCILCCPKMTLSGTSVCVPKTRATLP